MSALKNRWQTLYSKLTEHDGIKMTLIGGWTDLAGYYSGSDGNAWSFQGSWSNLGPLDQFKTRFDNGFYRGELLS